MEIDPTFTREKGGFDTNMVSSNIDFFLYLN